MIIWNGLTVHATYPNTSDQLRLVQYIRLMPALPVSIERDGHAPTAMSHSDIAVKKTLSSVQLSQLGRRLMGLEEWPATLN